MTTAWARRAWYTLLATLVGPLCLSAQSAGAGASARVPAIPAGRVLYTFCRADLAESWVRNDAIGTDTLAKETASAAVASTGSQPAPPCDPPPPTLPPGFLGYTFCRDGVAETWIRQDVVGSDRLAEIQAHEAVHRQQAAGYGRCEAFFATLRSARRIVEVEIPAYCAQLDVATRAGGDREALKREYALRISAQSGAMENRLDVLLAFRRACP